MKRTHIEFLFSSSFFIFVVFPSSSSVCEFGRYGDTCREYCGKCDARSVCDPVDGHCPGGCESGWRPPLCARSFPVLRNPPTLRNRSRRSLIIAWKRWKRNDDPGEGNPAFYLLQIKRPLEPEWVTMVRVEAHLWSEKDDEFEVRVHDVRQDVDYLLRVVVEDESGGSQENGVPLLSLPRSTKNLVDDSNGVDESEEVEDEDEEPKKRNSDYKWKPDFIWLGGVIFCAFVIAVSVVIWLECRRRRRRRQRNVQKTVTISMKIQDAGQDNEAYSEVRPTAPADDVTSDFDDDVFSDTRRETTTRGRRYGEHAGWRPAIPGLNLSTAQVESWSTDWLDSRIYENQTSTVDSA